MSTETKTTCPYCGVGCGVIATQAADGTVGIKGDPEHPANFGRLCSKGSALAETIDLDGRLLYPEIGGKRAEWDEALDLVAARFSQAIAEHGPDSVAFYVSGQFLTEDYYAANKLMKGFIGSGNIDTNSRLCMSSSVAGHRRAFGSDTVPGTYADLELADLVILTGSNLAWCHPVIYQRIAAAKQARSSMTVVLIDPRRTMTADIADLHLAIRPDSDVALFNGLLAHLVKSPALDQNYIAAHTTGFADAFAAASALSFADLIEETGLKAMDLRRFFALFEKTEKVVTAYSQGVNQSATGTDKVNAILNCHLVTGRIGRPGMGPFSLTGQPNAMGGREVGGLANMLAAHMHIESAADRDRVQRFWGSPGVAQQPGLKAVDMFQAAGDGRIKALWIMATNPVVSMPDASAVEAAIKACPFVVVSDILRDTDTTRHADVVLPSLGWGEKDGTVTNSERRISRQRGFLDAPGEAKADWWQIAEVARRMGYGAAFAFRSPAEIFSEHAALSAFENDGRRDFDIGAKAGIDADAFDAMQPFQWPQPAGSSPRETRFFAEGGFYHADGKARIVPLVHQPAARPPAYYPFVLNTGRIRDQWHTMTRTGKSARLASHIAEPFVEIHPRDAASLGIADATLVAIDSPRGSVVVRALLTARQAEGSLFVPMHWNDRFAAKARVDVLVPPLTDPLSGQPALKQAFVAAKPYAVEAYGFAVMAQRPASLDASYWALAKAEGGFRAELAFDVAPTEWAVWCREAFALPEGSEPLGYTDTNSGDHRIAFFKGGKLLAALFVAREPVAVSRNWAIGQLSEDHSDARMRFAVIAGRPGGGRPDAGATVCSCFGVGINQIVAAARDGCGTVEAIGKALNAGTNCGSCRAEIRGSSMDAMLPLPNDATPARIVPLAKLPVFWALEGKRVVLAGGSDGAAWKAELLAATGATVEIYGPAEDMGEVMSALIARGASHPAGGFVHHPHPWHIGIFDGAALALADCDTDDDARAFFCAARAAGVPVNVIDKPAFCQFQFGSIVNRSPVIVSISTDGAAPILAQAIRRRIETLLPPALKQWAELAQSLRDRVNARTAPGPARRRFWERFVDRAFEGNAIPEEGMEVLLMADLARDTSRDGPAIGRVTLVGAGPGDAELLTLKAVRALQAADVILFDDLVSTEVLELARREAKRMLVGKRGGRTSCKQEDINDMMVSLAKAGKRVVRLKSGDPMIFGRAGEEIARLKAEGIPVDVVPGITAASAMASRLGVSLTHRDHAQSVRFVTGHSRHGALPVDIDWRALADPKTTTIFYMGGRTAPDIATRLVDEGLSPVTPAVITANAARAGERRWTGTLGTLSLGMAIIGYDDPVLIGIGAVFSALDTACVDVAQRQSKVVSI